VWTDIAPAYSSQLNSIGNTVSASAGIVGPIVVAHLVQAAPGVVGWRMVFLLTFLLCASFTAVWYRYIRAEVVPALNAPVALESDVK
jgi:MFS family permease